MGVTCIHPMCATRLAGFPSSCEVCGAIFEAIGEAVLIFDNDLQVTYGNSEAHRIFGGDLTRALTPDERPAIFGIYNAKKVRLTGKQLPGFRALHGEEVYNEPLYVRNDALPKGAFLSATAKPLRDRDGLTVGVVLILRDMTRSVEQEERVQQSSHFAYVVSHDLREPLRKVRAFTERLRDRGWSVLDDRCRGYIDVVQRSATRMAAMIDGMLLLASVERPETPTEKVQLRSVIEAVLSDLSLRITDAQATVACCDQIDLPAVEADPVQMRLLFQNLISNALKFHRPGVTPVVTIRGKVCDDKALIEVEDNGIGFDAEYAERIFGVFERLHSREEFEGVGIGLAICQRIVEHHNGEIFAAGRPGHGAVFTVKIPVSQPRPAIKIVLVDDHPILRQGIKTRLSLEPDFAVVGEAGTGAEAPEVILRTSPDIVLVDFHLPDMTGAEVVHQIKSLNLKMTIIGLSMDTDLEATRAMLEAGAARHLPKNIDMSSLVAILRQCANDRG